MKQCWNGTEMGILRNVERETCPSATLSTTNPLWSSLGLKSVFRGESPAISAIKLLYSHCGLSWVSLFIFARTQKKKPKLRDLILEGNYG